jgi:threonine/homoserine/homoserine lactone efflux protein
VQVGGVSLLVVETAMSGGPRAGVAAGMGVATADLGFAVVAAAAGGAASAALHGYEDEIRLCAAAVLAVIAAHGLARLSSEPPASAPPAAAAYRRFLAITAVNPLTIASFAAIAASLSLDGPAAAAAFAAGAGLGSAAWHLLLPLAAARAGRWITPARRRRLAVGGRLAVLGFAAHLAASAAG